jgi:hypothetical protein
MVMSRLAGLGMNSDQFFSVKFVIPPTFFIED